MNYKDPKTGLSGVYATYRRFGGSIKETKKKLNDDSGYQINKQTGKVFYFPIRGRGVGSYQVDLMFPPPFNGIDTLLCCINVNSRYAYVYALRGKKKVYDAMKMFIKDAKDDKRPVVYLQSDKGSEFNNTKIKELLEESNIIYNTVKTADHAGQGKVERFNGTLRRLITLYCSSNDTSNWVDVISDLMYNYNNRINRMMGCSPAEADEYMQILRASKQYDMAKKAFDLFRVGDKVRTLKDKNLFDKGRKEWSKEIFEIDDIDHNTFIINGNKYKSYELQKINNGYTLSKEYENTLTATKDKKRQTRFLNKEGVSVVNIREKRERVIKYDKSLVGRRIDRGNGETGTITKYEEDGPFHFFVKYDKKALNKSEWMDAAEVKEFII
jgi:hypothetical protein